MTMSALQHRIFPPCLQIASPSSLSPQNVTLRPSQLRWAPSLKGLRFVPLAAGARVEDELSLYEEEFGAEEDVEEDEDEEEVIPSGSPNVRRTFRLLGNKEKKELRAYAHQLGNDICMHQVFSQFEPVSYAKRNIHEILYLPVQGSLPLLPFLK